MGPGAGTPTAPRLPGGGRKARRASNLAQLAEQAGASFADGDFSRSLSLSCIPLPLLLLSQYQYHMYHRD